MKILQLSGGLDSLACLLLLKDEPDLTVLSVLPQASRRRSRPNATHWTAPAGSGRSWTSLQVRASQTLMVRSQLAEASSSPSRLNATP